MLIDSHCHVPHHKYPKTVREIIDDALAQNVTHLITIGTSIEENKIVAQTANDYQEVFCTIGIYPHENLAVPITEFQKILTSQLALSKKIVAIGECGIDLTNWRGGRDLSQQIALFTMQIEVALQYKLPLVIHNRNGNEQILTTLQQYKTQNKNLIGVIHFFDATWNIAQKFLELGFYLSFSGMVTYDNKNALLDVVKKIPADKYLVETDAPYLPPLEHKGEINYPKYVRMIAQRLLRPYSRQVQLK